MAPAALQTTSCSTSSAATCGSSRDTPRPSASWRRSSPPDFQTGFVGGHLWTGIDGLRDFLAARSPCFHTWRVRHEGGRWRVAAQLVERFAALNDNAERLFATPQEGLQA